MRRNVIILILVMILVGVVYFLFVFRPQSNNIADTRAEADRAEDQVQQLELELKRLEALKAQAPQLRERVVKLDAAMPTLDPKLADFILQVQEAANTSGIEWLSIAPTPPAANPTIPNVSEVNISMQITGGYFQVQDFLVRLENLSRAVKIASIALTPDDLPTLSAALTMKMFMSTAPALAPPAAAPASGG